MAKKKVLLVDDSSTTLMLEKLILSHGAYDIVTARDGAEAVEKARDERPDLILMDVVMPRLSGLEACREIRAQGMLEIPIIVVTTRGEAHNREAGFAHGCTDYLTKPISSVELLSKVRNLLGE
jgi:CheY-like chemotaxis protein